MPLRLPVEFLKVATRRSSWILIATGAGLSLGLLSFAAWLITSDGVWLKLFFDGPGVVLMVALTAVEVWLSFSVRRAFVSDEPMHLAWTLIGVSAICDFLGTACVQWLSSGSPLNPLLRLPAWAQSTGQQLHDIGFVLGGTSRYALLAAGLLYVVRIYRLAGFPGRLAAIDWILLFLVFAYVVNEFREVVVAFEHGKSLRWLEVLGWPVDPLLCLLLFQTRLLAHSIKSTGMGSIARCWRAFTIGVLFVWLGDLGNWAVLSGHLSWQWNSLSWYVWLPAAGAFAAAPAYQLEAINQAMDERRTRPPATAS